MSKGNSIPGDQIEVLARIRRLAERETRAYVSSLTGRTGEDRIPLEEARALIDDAMGERNLTELLYDTRKPRVL